MQWDCESCNFNNDDSSTICEMCEIHRTPSSSSVEQQQPPQEAPGSKRLKTSANNSYSSSSSSSSSLLPSPPPKVTIGEGESAFTVNAIGIGLLPLSIDYSSTTRPSRSDAIKLLRFAIESKVQFFDVGDTYGADQSDLHYGEGLLKEAFEGVGEEVRRSLHVATKAGMMRVDDTSSGWRPQNPPYNATTLKARIYASHKALGLKEGEPIDLWSFHHTDNYDTVEGT
jgi:hypothetical protein